jgi:hypothetical protein
MMRGDRSTHLRNRCFGRFVVFVGAASLCIVDASLVAQTSLPMERTTQRQPPVTCPVTVANDVGILGRAERGVYGNGEMSVGTWPKGVVVFSDSGHGFRTSDGGVGTKFGWRRGIRGRLTISGHRLDASAKPLRAHVNNGEGDFGRQSSYLVFPTSGCWEVTGHVGNASLTFVTWVVIEGNGPRDYWAEL